MTIYTQPKNIKNYYNRKPFINYSTKTLYLYSPIKKGIIWIYVQQMLQDIFFPYGKGLITGFSRS